MSQCFAKPYERSIANANVELDLFNYATKTYLKGATDIDTSKLASKSDLASSNIKVDNLDLYKRNTVPADLLISII